MMPLNVALPGEENIIRKIGGSPEVKQHLADLDADMARRIMI